MVECKFSGTAPRHLLVLAALVLMSFTDAQAQTSPTWTYAVPNQSAEQATYDNVLHWTWTASEKVPQFTSAYGGPVGTGFDVHDDSEGDDLWTHYQQYLRTGNPVYREWARGWRNYYVTSYLADLESSCGRNFVYDHTYGQGLVLWAHYENDPTALAAAGAIADLIESYDAGVTPGTERMAYWGSRSKARQLLVSIYIAQETGVQRWINLRNKLIDAWVQSPDWQSGVIGGNYFVSIDTMFAAGSTDVAYRAGRRANSAFQIGLHVEALWRAYLATGRVDVRDKLINIARWTEYYAHDPSYVNPMVGAWFGQNGDGTRWHRDADSGNANVKGTDPVYDLALVNTLVIGYKLTGQVSMLNLAKTLFRTGTIYPAGGVGESSTGKLVADNEVQHYVDTLTNPDKFLFDYNKGELQYSYLLFENNGNPVVMANLVAPMPPVNLTAH